MRQIPETPDLLSALGDLKSRRFAVLGIGGGGDIISTIPVCLELERRGAQAIPGGLSWKRSTHDPARRPRRLREFTEITVVGEHVGVVTPDTRTLEGVAHVESFVSQMLGGRAVFVIDPSDGSLAVAQAFVDMRSRFHVDTIIGVDVGGDVLCSGHEETLESPLCDQTMLHALQANDSLLLLASVGTDGEIGPKDFVARFEQIVRAGGFQGVFAPNPADLPAWRGMAEAAQTESSRFAPVIYSSLSQARISELSRRLVETPLSMAAIMDPTTPLPLRGGNRQGFSCDLTAFFLGFSSTTVWRTGRFCSIWRPEVPLAEMSMVLAQQGIITEFSEKQV